MPVMDEYREEREAIKHASNKEKCKYFWDYYKWHTIGAVVAIITICGILYTFITKQETALHAAIINGYVATEEGSTTVDDFQVELLAELEKEPKKHVVHMDSSLHMDFTTQDMSFVTSQQKLVTLMAAGEIDNIVTDQDTFGNLGKNAIYRDLRECLTEAEVVTYADAFYYMDLKDLKDMDDAIQNMDTTYLYPDFDPRAPETMENPIPVGLFLSPDSKLRQLYEFQDDQVVIGIVQSSKRLDSAQTFLDLAIAR